MSALGLLFAYVAPVAAGVVAVRLLEREPGTLSRLEALALGAVVGPGLLAFYIFYLGLAGVRFTFYSILPFFLAALAAGWILLRRRRGGSARAGTRFSWKKLTPAPRAMVIIASLLLAVKTALVAFTILAKPTYFDDSVSNYNYKAKVFYYQRSLMLDKNHPGFLGGHEPRYPDGVPLFKMWVAICVGGWEDGPVNLYTLLLFLSLGVIAHRSFLRFLDPVASLAFTYVLLSIPLLTFHAGAEHQDFIVGTYYFAGLVYLIRWIGGRARTDFLLSALLFGVGLSIKDEMLALFAGGAVPVLILGQLSRPGRWKTVAATTARYLFLVALLNLPWFIIKRVYDLSVGIPPHYRRFEFHPEAFGLFAANFFASGNYNILWAVFFCALVLSARLISGSELKYILTALAGAMLVTLSLFIFTPFFEYLLTGTTFSRAILMIVPVLVLYIARVYGLLVWTRSETSSAEKRRR